MVTLNQPVLPLSSAIAPALIPEFSEKQIRQLAQVEGRTLVFFRTDDYAVRVLDRGTAGLFMNVFNQRSGIQEQNGVPAAVLPRQQGEPITYLSSSARDGGVAYIATVSASNSAELQIVDAEGTVLERESSNTPFLDLPGIVLQGPGRELETLINHEGEVYSARVLERTDGEFMNVFDKSDRTQVVNGRPARLIPPTGQYSDWTTYASDGTSDGIPVTYYLRASPRGRTQLDIVRRSSGVSLFSEATGPRQDNGSSVTALTDAYVVAVPGNQTTLNRLLPAFPQAYIDRSVQGNFVNTGAFRDRNLAFARMFELRSQGFDARVIYRSVSYR
ncbi:MAG: hypothetical protein HC886_24035 [Leptolyngbyaceae cyanobacterium SM1_1_3]|nr:hypothetical protein [Leptolyngbyaceae cyanobacterium SM1_1_3]NJN04662.1 hypothetical protein [Leptolyngbyaceae cyanobacterium RM1_1_2]